MLAAFAQDVVGDCKWLQLFRGHPALAKAVARSCNDPHPLPQKRAGERVAPRP